MGRTRERFRVAPRGVVRAAAWSLDVLCGFGETELHAPAGVPMNDSGPPASYEQAYRSALERERAHLWSCTRDDPMFVKGVLLSSPSAYLRMQSAAGRLAGPRNRAMRLVEHTIYRYLARAAGRATPQGLWAGVTEVRLGAESRVERVPARCHFTPDLRPYQRLARALGLRTQYRNRTLWHLNPSLQPRAEGGWRFFHRGTQGMFEERHLAFDPALARLLECLAVAAPSELPALARELAATHGPATAAAWSQVLDGLANGGVMVGGLDLPTKFTTAWEALDATAERLLPDDRRAWQATCAAMRDHCAGLSDGVWSMSPGDFAATLAEPVNATAVLAARLGCPEPATAETVRCDLHLPWRLVVDHAQYRALCTALVDYDRHWQHGASAAAAEREQRRRWFASQLTGGRTLAEASALITDLGVPDAPVWPAPSSIEHPETAARLALWEDCLRLPGPQVTLTSARATATLAAAPYGCWLAGLGNAGGWRATGISDLPTIASARYGDVLDLVQHNRWLQAAFAASSSHAGVGFTEFRASFDANPNALASPALLATAVAPWDAGLDTRSLCGARMLPHPVTGQPVLQFADDEQPQAVLALSTANLQAGDPLAEALLWSGFRDSPGRAQRAVDIPTASELARSRYTPRITLPHGAVLCARRSVLGVELAELRRLRGAERFWYWQRLAARFEWPALLEVASERGGSLHVPRDSPLAVEALCKGLTADARYLMVQESPPDAGLPIPGSGPHMVELAFPFIRQAANTGIR